MYQFVPCRTKRQASNYSCLYCSYVTYSNAGLQKHLVKHTGARPFVCEICNKGFTQKHNLKLHMLVHSGLKPYVCEICNKSYR
ncbi:Zinc finger and BTB domain-containing protein 46, partial [Stegodyphus mimosarum]